jgi:hypothetical protein
VPKLPAAAAAAAAAIFRILCAVSMREKQKQKRNEVSNWSVEHGFAGTFGTSNKYRMMNPDRSGWMDSYRPIRVDGQLQQTDQSG